MVLNFKLSTKNTKGLKTPNQRPHKIVYLFFLVHMFAFGGSGFALAYSDTPFMMAAMHSGIAIFVYIVFYIVLFGVGRVVWMFVFAIVGFAQTYFVINFIGDIFINNWDFDNYPFYRHIAPAIYVVMYLFLVREFIYDIVKSDSGANFLFLFINAVLYFYFYMV